MPLMRISNGDHGPRIVGAEETDMLFGHCALDKVSTRTELGRRDVLVDASTLLWIRHIHANAPEQIPFIHRTPIHVCIVSKTACHVLLPHVRSLWPIRTLSSCNEAR